VVGQIDLNINYSHFPLQPTVTDVFDVCEHNS